MRKLALLLMFCCAPCLASAQETDAARLLARADSAFRAQDTATARAAYRRVLELDPAHSRATFQLALLEAPGTPEQLRLLERYTQLEPEDAWGWGALGAAHGEAGTRDAARAAYRRALELAPGEDEFTSALARLEPAQQRRVTLEPALRVTEDSDGTRLTRSGGSASFAPRPRDRVGVEAARITLSAEGHQEVEGWDAYVLGEWRPGRATLLTGRVGVINASDGTAGTDVREPVLHARARWRPERGPALEVRARHEPLSATPQLLAAPVVLSELRAVLEVPVAGPLYARAVGRHGRLRDSTGTNTRTLLGAGPVLRVAPAFELNSLAGRSGYAQPSNAGYFAPERVDVLDAGFYFEHDGDALVFALDAGGGLERITRFAEARGDWGRALRLWSQASLWFSPAAGLRLEVEAYDTRAGEVVAADTDGWRWVGLGTSLIIRF